MAKTSFVLRWRRAATWSAVFLVGLAAAMAARSWQTSAATTSGSAVVAKVSVQTTTVEIRAVPQIVEAVGKVAPSNTVEVRPQVGGILKQILIKDGDRVEAGQLLFEIDSQPLKAALAQAEAQWNRDKALAATALDTETRMKPLAGQKLVAPKDYASAVNSRVSLQAAAEATRTQIDQARIALDYAQIRAPVAGRTGAVLVKSGTLLALGTTSLVVINAISPADVAFAVPQAAFADIRAANSQAPLKVEVLDSRTQTLRATGDLVFIDNAFNDVSGTIGLKARFANADESLWPGESYTVRVVLKVDSQAVTVPEQSLQQGQQGPFVYVVKDGKATIRLLQIAHVLDGQAVVAKGLSGGEAIALSIPDKLRDGSSVDISQAESAVASATKTP
jgi:RND family efflux transporter MFP subunit